MNIICVKQPRQAFKKKKNKTQKSFDNWVSYKQTCFVIEMTIEWQKRQPLQPDLRNKTHTLINFCFSLCVTQVVYFTAVFPYFILFALLINNVQLPGAKNGILYFVTPVWSKLFEVKVRVNEWVKKK